MKNVGNSSSGHSQGVSKIFSAPIYNVYGTLRGHLCDSIAFLFRNPAKSGSGKISSRICQIPAQLQYVQSVKDTTSAADLTGGVCIHNFN